MNRAPKSVAILAPTNAELSAKACKIAFADDIADALRLRDVTAFPVFASPLFAFADALRRVRAQRA